MSNLAQALVNHFFPRGYLYLSLQLNMHKQTVDLLPPLLQHISLSIFTLCKASCPPPSTDNRAPKQHAESAGGGFCWCLWFTVE